MIRSVVYRECAVVIIFTLCGVALARLHHHGYWWLLLALLGYGGWHITQSVRLLRWLVRDSAADVDIIPPQSWGLWAEVFDALYRRQHSFRFHREQLQNTATTARDIAAAFSDALVMVDEHGRVSWCNEPAARLLGLSYPRDKGRMLVDLVRDTAFSRYYHRADFREALTMRLARQQACYLDIAITEYGAGQRLLMVRDITKFSRLERMRVDFVANVSHELRTPLTVINGYLETLSSLDNESVPLAMLKRALLPMQAQCSRMEALVNDLTTLSRLESRSDARESWQMIEVASLVERLVAEAPLMPDDGKRIVVEVAPTPLLLGQEKEIHSAFGNLVNNACKYTQPGGCVNIVWRLEAGRAVFEVRDDGDGIEAEHLPRLTERFYRVDKSRSVSTGGTGLGLAIVKHALMRHQATLEIDSEPGVGSCFRCVFPLHRVRLP